MTRLEKVVWEGYGQLLIKHTSGHSKIRKFLEAVPRLLVSGIVMKKKRERANAKSTNIIEE